MAGVCCPQQLRFFLRRRNRSRQLALGPCFSTCHRRQGGLCRAVERERSQNGESALGCACHKRGRRFSPALQRSRSGQGPGELSTCPLWGSYLCLLHSWPSRGAGCGWGLAGAVSSLCRWALGRLASRPLTHLLTCQRAASGRARRPGTERLVRTSSAWTPRRRPTWAAQKAPLCGAPPPSRGLWGLEV